MKVQQLLKLLGVSPTLWKHRNVERLNRCCDFWHGPLNHVEILGEAKANWLVTVKQVHPDKGGSEEACSFVNSVWAVIEKRFKEYRHTLGLFALLLSTLAAIAQPLPPKAARLWCCPPWPNVGYVVLAWDASPEPQVTDYRVHYGTVGGNVTNISATTQTTNRIGRLAVGVEHWFYVTARDGYGQESDPSTVLTGRPAWKVAPPARTNMTLPWPVAVESGDLKAWHPCPQRVQAFTGSARFFRESRQVGYPGEIEMAPSCVGTEVRFCESPGGWDALPYRSTWVWPWEDRTSVSNLFAGVTYWVCTQVWETDTTPQAPTLLTTWKAPF
jgi:hypothetical protein